jgi:hypothetical protein
MKRKIYPHQSGYFSEPSELDTPSKYEYWRGGVYEETYRSKNYRSSSMKYFHFLTRSFKVEEIQCIEDSMHAFRHGHIQYILSHTCEYDLQNR